METTAPWTSILPADVFTTTFSRPVIGPASDTSPTTSIDNAPSAVINPNPFTCEALLIEIRPTIGLVVASGSVS